MSLCIIAEKMSKGESIFRGEGITVEDEFTNDTFDDEEDGGEGWLEDGDEVRDRDTWKSSQQAISRLKQKKLRDLKSPTFCSFHQTQNLTQSNLPRPDPCKTVSYTFRLSRQYLQ